MSSAVLINLLLRNHDVDISEIAFAWNGCTVVIRLHTINDSKLVGKRHFIYGPKHGKKVWKLQISHADHLVTVKNFDTIEELVNDLQFPAKDTDIHAAYNQVADAFPLHPIVDDGCAWWITFGRHDNLSYGAHVKPYGGRDIAFTCSTFISSKLTYVCTHGDVREVIEWVKNL